MKWRRGGGMRMVGDEIRGRRGRKEGGEISKLRKSLSIHQTNIVCWWEKGCVDLTGNELCVQKKKECQGRNSVAALFRSMS
jgi:hypothetical protein